MINQTSSSPWSIHALSLCTLCFLQTILSQDLSVGGYLPDYRFYINANNTALFLTDLMIFSVSPEPALGSKMLSACCLNEDHYRIAREAQLYKKERGSGALKIWLTVGGAGRSHGFMTKPQALLESILSLAIEEKLDGIDLDCEFFESQDSYRRYVSWLQSAATTFHSHGLLVSVALHSGQLLPSSLYAHLDRIHLMTYDMNGKYHADMVQVEASVKSLIDSGCSPQKIMVGIPAYARHSENPADVKMFAEIVDILTERGAAEADLDDMEELQGYRYDSPKSVRRKVRYALDRGLAGLFLWELGQDKQTVQMEGGILLTATSLKSQRDEL